MTVSFQCLEIEPRPDGLLFRKPEGSPRLPDFPLAEDTEPTPVLSQLEALWAEGRLQALEDAFFLPLKEFYELAPEEREVLSLPSPDPDVGIELRTVGGARTTDFGVRAILRHPTRGILPPTDRVGPFIRLGTGLVVLDADAATLLNILDQTPPTSPVERLAYIGDVKVAAEPANASLDAFLENELIIRPEAVGVELDLRDHAEGLMSPTLETESGRIQVPGFDTDIDQERPYYFKPDGPRRERVVLDPAQRATVKELRKKEPLSGPELLTFLDNPEAFLPEALDLARFSPRVRGFLPKRYNSQPYVRAERSGQRDWFVLDPSIELTPIEPPAFFEVDQPDPGETRNKDRGAEDSGPQVDPKEYRRLCEEVLKTGQGYQPMGDGWIFIDPITAEKYLETFKAAELDEAGRWVVNVAAHPFVLDVISNLDELEYSDAGIPPPVPEVPEYALPTTFIGSLYDHQTYGYRWLRFLLERGLGGLLADDMGLGKTIQALALFAALAEKGELTPSLVVAPLALVENWERELAQFAPIVAPTYRHQGSDRHQTPEAIARNALVFTTYQTLRRDQLLLGQVDWKVVACDEAQFVKNPTAQSTSAVKALKAKLRLAVTGTPVENGLSELWCIVDFAQPGKLGSQKEFRDTFERPIRDSTTPEDLHALATELQRRLTPHYVRRLKEDVLQLPSKTSKKLSSSLSERQKQQYVRIVRLVRGQEMHALDAVNRLIQVCSHPELQEPTGADSTTLLEDAPKLGATLELLMRVKDAGEKAVVFTRYRRMQQILQTVLASHLGVHAPVINGTVGGPERVELVDRFNKRSGFGVLLISPDAGGVGLNITGANHVIHYTRLWNPAKENQATDRVHRIGQVRPVTVYYPVVHEDGFVSVEERLNELLEEKLELARNVLWPRDRLEIKVEDLAGILFEGEL